MVVATFGGYRVVATFGGLSGCLPRFAWLLSSPAAVIRLSAPLRVAVVIACGGYRNLH
jgi:hypothetical protein